MAFYAHRDSDRRALPSRGAIPAPMHWFHHQRFPSALLLRQTGLVMRRDDLNAAPCRAVQYRHKLRSMGRELPHNHRLLIVVPYRDRADHLARFVPYLRAYFAREKQDSSIDYSVLITEQEQRLPFNAGALKNAGFVLGEAQSDYTCFHDIDYLPVWSDYSWCEAPTPLVWFGAETRPVARGQSNYYLRHDLSQLFGAALLVPNELFRAVDGYSNEYWGWGFEDRDLRTRFLARGIALGRRKGTYRALDHVNAGYDLQGKPRAIAEANRLLFEAKHATPMQGHSDGLSTVRFEVVSRAAVPDPQPERAAPWEIVKVRLLANPSVEQTLAIDSEQNPHPLPRTN